jgi:hypothetical protein
MRRGRTLGRFDWLSLECHWWPLAMPCDRSHSARVNAGYRLRGYSSSASSVAFNDGLVGRASERPRLRWCAFLKQGVITSWLGTREQAKVTCGGSQDTYQPPFRTSSTRTRESIPGPRSLHDRVKTRHFAIQARTPASLTGSTTSLLAVDLLARKA